LSIFPEWGIEKNSQPQLEKIVKVG